MNLNKCERVLEAILFACGDPVALDLLSKGINQDEETTTKILLRLKDHYDLDERGLQLIEIEGKYQLSTRKEYYPYIKSIVDTPVKFVMTDALIETLAIISYKQPITKTQIEDIRGVRCDHVMNKLVEYNLITEQGRMHAPGRPILFGTTDEFLRYFGLKDTKDLPDITEEMMAAFKEEAAATFNHIADEDEE